jgi:hypothetical protein
MDLNKEFKRTREGREVMIIFAEASSGPERFRRYSDWLRHAALWAASLFF